MSRVLVVLAFLFGGGVVAWAEEPPTIQVGGASRDAASLRGMAEEARQAAEVARAAPTTDKALVDAMVLEAETLVRAADLIEAIVDLPAATEAATERSGRAKAALQQAQEEAARAIVLDAVDEKGIAEYEAKARQHAIDAKTAADAATVLSVEIDDRKAAIAQASDRRAQRDARAAQLKTSLAETPEDDLAKRELLQRELRTIEARMGIALLQARHHAALLELATLLRDATRTEAAAETTRQKTADTVLARARTLYESRLAEEAARKEEETRRTLREAELAASPAVRAIKFLEGLAGRMEAEQTSERRQLSLLKTLQGEEAVLARISASRLESAKALLPAGTALESWQEEALAEYLRQLDRDIRMNEVLLGGRLPSTMSIRAQTVTDRGRLDVFQQRLDLAQDRTDLQVDDERVARLEKELSYAQWEDVRLWIQARLDFIRGQTELRPDEVERLRVQWQEATTRLSSIVRDRAEGLAQTEAVLSDLAESLAQLEESLADRRSYLDRIAFWVRSAPLWSGAYLGAVAGDGQALVSGVAAAPAHVAAVREQIASTPGATSRIAMLLAFLLSALGFRFWLVRRIDALAVVTRPIRELDALQRVARTAAVLLRAVFLPLFVLAAILWARRWAPDEILVIIVMAPAIAWLGFALARGVSAAFFTADADGQSLSGAPEETARRARQAVFLALGTTGLWLGAALALNQAGLYRLREVLGFAWAFGAVVWGAWLWARRDVLISLLPREDGSALARTARSLLLVAWPIGVLLWGVNLVLSALGYRTASSFFAERAFLLAAAFLVLGTTHALLRAWILRHAASPSEDQGHDTYDPVVAKRQVRTRLLSQLLGVATLIAAISILSAVFEIEADDWRALGAWSFTDSAAGVGLTIRRLFKSVVIFVVTLLIARHTRDLVRAYLRGRPGIEVGTRYVIRTLLFYVILVVGSVAALAALGLDMTQFGWFLTAAGVGIGFGLQEILSNLISGLILFFERPVQVGDVVSIGDVQGDVQQINIRSTVVRTRDGVSIILPNKRLITDEVINWSHGRKRTRLQIEVGVAYGSDTDLVRRVLLECATASDRVMRRPEPEVEFRGFGDSQLTFILYCWLVSPDITLRRLVRSELNSAVDKAFAANGITIPFPQRDVHLKRPPPPDA